MRRHSSLGILLGAGIAALLFPAGAAVARELFTIRIENTASGSVQVRMAGQRTWTTVGRVIEPATCLVPTFDAAAFVVPSAVAATAVHGIRIRVPSVLPEPMGISIQPREFQTLPERYGGHIPGKSGIDTDIPAGTAIFRQLAPVVGDPVYLEEPGGPVPLPADWKPADGDVILIKSQEPDNPPQSVIFENHKGGAVIVVNSSGQKHRIGTVVQAVTGVGRFDGTSYTGVGAINTNHGGVITISTAPDIRPVDEGAPPEDRGGFEIQPYQHAKTQPEMTQAMIVDPDTPGNTFEGEAPLFDGTLTLGDGSDVVDVQSGTSKWYPMPEIVGKIDDAFTPAGLARLDPQLGKTGYGITAIRILRQPRRLMALTEVLAKLARPDQDQDLAHTASQIEWTLKPPYPPGTAFVVFSAGGKTLTITNTLPFRVTADLAKGQSLLNAEMVASDGTTLQRRTARVRISKGMPVLKVSEGG